MAGALRRRRSPPETLPLEGTYTDNLTDPCFLFLRKNKKDKDDGTEFYFLGEMHPTGHFEQIVMEDGSTSAVEITYDLETPVRADLYDYFLSSFDK